MQTNHLAVVRPHNERVRAQVFAVLEMAGIATGAPQVVAPHTPTDQVANALSSLPPRSVLLVPFHQHLDINRQQVNGLETVVALAAIGGQLATAPVLMPLSVFSRPGYGLKRSRMARHGELTPEIERRILVMDEDQLGDIATMAARVRAHIAEHTDSGFRLR